MNFYKNIKCWRLLIGSWAKLHLEIYFDDRLKSKRNINIMYGRTCKHIRLLGKLYD